MADDLRFVYDGTPPWRSGGKQFLQGTDFTTMEPKHSMSDKPLTLKWNLKNQHPLLFDWNTRFVVEGEFQTRDTEADAWNSCSPADSAEVMVVPNWWGILVRKMKLSHSKGMVSPHDEPFNVGNHLEQFLYWGMDPVLKKQLCAEDCHPANGIPNKRGDWTFNTNETVSSWQKYSKSIFVRGPIKFCWTPLYFFPFFQGSNHLCDRNRSPRCLPTTYLDNLRVHIELADNFDIIFKKREACTKEYRFHLEKVDLICEEARLDPLIEKKLFQSRQKTLSYLGVTKRVRAETIQSNTWTFRSRFENIFMPEGVMVYALPKSVVKEDFKFSDWNETDPFFLKNNIESVDFSYGGVTLGHSEHHLGTVNNEIVDLKRVMQYEKSGPFGLKFAQKRITRANLKNGWEDTDFPHIFVNLCPSGSDSRILPLSGEYFSPKKKDFVVFLKFNGEGAVPNATYVVNLYYTGTNMELDLKEKKFANPIFAW